MEYTNFGYDFNSNSLHRGGSSNSNSNFNDLPPNPSHATNNSRYVDQMIDYLTQDNADLKARNKTLEDRLEAYNSRIDTLSSKIDELNKDNLALNLANSSLQAKVDLRSLVTK
jgi:chromosome segregation ATPase